MKETKLKERLENAVEAFFDNEKLGEHTVVNYENTKNVYQQDLSVNSNEKSNIFVSILKQIFLFVPATFILFITSYALTIFAINKPLNAHLPGGGEFWLVVWFSISIFMTWFGIGDWRKPKHVVIPASIVGFGFIIGLIFGFLSFSFPEIYRSDSYLLWSFPIALVVPFIAKMFVDDLEKK